MPETDLADSAETQTAEQVSHQQTKRKSHWSRLRWTSMRMLGKIQFFKVSYFVLVGVPLFALIQHHLPVEMVNFKAMPLLFRLTYFSSLLLSCAHMIYQGYCPEIIKRFDSPNDLYRNLLEIKTLQNQCLPKDEAFHFDIAHCRDNFELANDRWPTARLWCSMFYISGIFLFGCVLTIQALRVIGVFV